MSATNGDTVRQISEIQARRNELWDEWERQWEIKRTTGYVGPEAEAAEARILEIDAERAALMDDIEELRAERDREIDHMLYGFSRPGGRLVNLLNRPLGPLPKHAVVVEPSKEAFKQVRSYWFAAAVTVVVAITSLVLLVTYVPGMGVSPYSATYAGFAKLFGSESLASILTVVTFVLMMNKIGIELRRIPSEGKFFARAAMTEELWFRMGAETWTWRQRMYSCFAFGFVHVFNFIYPVASLLVVGVVGGGAMMIVYLREYSRSHDTKRATLASAKFHATYNYIAIAYMVVALAYAFGLFGLISYIIP